jgi:lysophospholipase L1-like esterase
VRRLAAFKVTIAVLRDAWLIVGTTLLLIALLQGIFWTASRLRHGFHSQSSSVTDPRAHADAYRGSPWIDSYFKEFREISAMRWEPYVYWRRMAHRGTYINIDANGLRVTPQARSSADTTSRPLRVFMFGGSALWGTGVRDSGTIPAFLARDLEAWGLPAEVTNFGETGYVSTQEVIELVLQLQKGNIPDLVVFYDGANDTFSAFQLKTAGLTQNEFNRAREFNLTKPERFKDLLAFIMTEKVGKMSAIRFLRTLLKPFGLTDRSETDATSRSAASAPGEAELAREVVSVYLNNMRVVDALAASYGFERLSYWQPTIFGKADLSDYENGELSKEDPAMRAFFKETYRIMDQSAATGGSRLHDLGALFADVADPLYIDWVHLCERGNGVVARRMLRDILPLSHALPRVGRATVPGAQAIPFRPSARHESPGRRKV